MVLTAREIFAIITSIALAIPVGFLVHWNVNELLSEQAVIAYFLIGGIVAVLVYGFKKRAERFFNKYEKHLDEPINQEKSLSPILPEYRERYHNHIKEDIFGTIIKNLSSLPQAKQDYFKALRVTTEKKPMIFQHFSTNQLISQRYSNLYEVYRAIVAMYNDLDKQEKSAIKAIEKFEDEIWNLDFMKDRTNNWFQLQDLLSAMHLQKNDPLEALRSDSFMGYSLPTSIYWEFSIKWDETKKEWRLGTRNNPFAGSKDKAKLEALQNFIAIKGLELHNLVSPIHSGRNTGKRFIENLFNEEFQQRLDSLVGDPTIGACESCYVWFNSIEGKKYKTIIDEFNSDMENYTEVLWKPARIDS